MARVFFSPHLSRVKAYAAGNQMRARVLLAFGIFPHIHTRTQTRIEKATRARYLCLSPVARLQLERERRKKNSKEKENERENNGESSLKQHYMYRAKNLGQDVMKRWRD